MHYYITNHNELSDIKQLVFYYSSQRNSQRTVWCWLVLFNYVWGLSWETEMSGDDLNSLGKQSPGGFLFKYLVLGMGFFEV